jgi:hypothetical protein
MAVKDDNPQGDFYSQKPTKLLLYIDRHINTSILCEQSGRKIIEKHHTEEINGFEDKNESLEIKDSEPLITIKRSHNETTVQDDGKPVEILIDRRKSVMTNKLASDKGVIREKTYREFKALPEPVRGLNKGKTTEEMETLPDSGIHEIKNMCKEDIKTSQASDRGEIVHEAIVPKEESSYLKAPLSALSVEKEVVMAESVEALIEKDCNRCLDCGLNEPHTHETKEFQITSIPANNEPPFDNLQFNKVEEGPASCQFKEHVEVEALRQKSNNMEAPLTALSVEKELVTAEKIEPFIEADGAQEGKVFKPKTYLGQILSTPHIPTSQNLHAKEVTDDPVAYQFSKESYPSRCGEVVNPRMNKEAEFLQQTSYNLKAPPSALSVETVRAVIEVQGKGLFRVTTEHRPSPEQTTFHQMYGNEGENLDCSQFSKALFTENKTSHGIRGPCKEIFKMERNKSVIEKLNK